MVSQVDAEVVSQYDDGEEENGDGLVRLVFEFDVEEGAEPDVVHHLVTLDDGDEDVLVGHLAEGLLGSLSMSVSWLQLVQRNAHRAVAAGVFLGGEDRIVGLVIGLLCDGISDVLLLACDYSQQ